MESRNRRLSLALLVLAAVLAVSAAGCGGGSSGDAGGTETTAEENGGADGESTTSSNADVDTSSPSYLGGYELCEEGSVEYVAGLFGAEPTKESVALAVAEQVGGAAGEAEFAAGRQGCLDAFEAKG